MTRGQMLTELQATGFGSTTAEITRQRNWLNQAYLWVWSARDPSGAEIQWSFQKVDQAPLAVVGGTAMPVMPADFGSVDYMEDDQGSQLAELDPEKFDEIFAPSAAQGQTSQRAEAYKVVNRKVTLGPTPSTSANYTWSYTRRVAHFNKNSAVTSGTFTDDNDTPLWPDHHMVIVHAAALTGHAMNSNPFSQLHAQLRQDALDVMRGDLEHEIAPAQVWGSSVSNNYGI